MSGYQIGHTDAHFVGKADTPGQILQAVTVTSNGTGGTPSAWTEAIASTSVDYYVVGASASSAAGGVDALPVVLEIARGGSGSEVTQATMAIEGFSTSIHGAGTLPCPVRITAGSRIAVRITLQAAAGGATVDIRLFLVPYSSVEGN